MFFQSARPANPVRTIGYGHVSSWFVKINQYVIKRTYTSIERTFGAAGTIVNAFPKIIPPEIPGTLI
jgi:hypothetical protein